MPNLPIKGLEVGKGNLISIKKLVSRPDACQTLTRAVHLLVQGIAHSVMEFDADDCSIFTASANALSTALAEGIEPEDLLVQVGSVLKGFDEYTRQAMKRQRLQTSELKNIVKMLTSTVGGIAALNSDNVAMLGEIEKQVSSASELGDIRLIKAKLSDCLTEIRHEAERQASQASETVQRLSSELATVRERSASLLASPERDVLTGLLTRSEAEAALAQCAQDGSRAHVVLIVYDRLQVLNERFGRDVGDEILAAFARMLQKRFQAKDRLFRWGGPAFLVLALRQETIEQVRTEFSRVMATKVEHSIQTRNLDVLVPLTGRWSVIPLMAAPRLLYQKLDAFAGVRPPSN